MRILGIETSCDETAAAIVEDGTTILSSTLASSQHIQVKYGGIMPEMAAREQVRSIIPVINESLHLVKGSKSIGSELFSQGRDVIHDLLHTIDAIAVTAGPGLIGSLLVGVETAKTFAYILNKPIIPINHHLGHIYASWLSKGNLPTASNQVPNLPAICLIVSGGHTLLLFMTDHGKWKILGQTRDDAAGEAFDKTARLLGFPYPGGPEIERAAKNSLEHGERRFKFPRPMLDSEDYDFSFSGLKTAVFREVNKLGIMNQELGIRDEKIISDLAAGVQEAIVDVLVDKTMRAAKEYNVKSIIIGGGVAANKRLKTKFEIRNSKFEIFTPPPSLCTDNAAVIASAAFFNNKPVPWQEVVANPRLPFPIQL